VAIRRLGRATAGIALVLVMTATASCQVSQLEFRADDRLSFVSPRARHRITLPVSLHWSMKSFTPTGLDGSHDRARGAFAVFVDRAPIGVGSDLKAVASGDQGCRRDPRCPDSRYLADHNVYVVTETALLVRILPQAGKGRGDERHYVNIVLIDGSGHRIGESAWYLPFRTKRRSR
jgi:hypothetical protein